MLALLGTTAANSAISEFNYYDTFAYLSWDEILTETEYRNGEIFYQNVTITYDSTVLAPNDIKILNDGEEQDDEYVLTFGWSGKVKYWEYSMVDFYPL